MSTYFTSLNNSFELTSKLLKSYSYHSVLERGFALVSTPSGQIISQAIRAQNKKNLMIQFSDGSISVHPIKTSVQRSAVFEQQGDLFDEK